MGDLNVTLHHDGVFVPNPLKYVCGFLKILNDIRFEEMQIGELFEIINRLVLNNVKHIYYCLPDNTLTRGIRKLKKDIDMVEFIRIGYENDKQMDLFIEHDVYDVLEYTANDNLVVKGKSYPVYDPEECWKENKPVLGMRNDSESLLVYCGRDTSIGRCASKKKLRKIQEKDKEKGKGEMGEKDKEKGKGKLGEKDEENGKGKMMWKASPNTPPLPPIIQKMSGRPRKKRVRHPTENDYEVSKVGRQMTCQLCYKTGHNKQTYTAEKQPKPQKSGKPPKPPSYKQFSKHVKGGRSVVRGGGSVVRGGGSNMGRGGGNVGRGGGSSNKRGGGSVGRGGGSSSKRGGGSVGRGSRVKYGRRW
ncbi:hypothetical protein Tco_0890741 [Tanacetum coccineum]|uniref:PB1-like domain-containing protein n=1 Tax=Tanacetum coccineum TaxID=301880 RepID=A0ABQ5C6G4_9ASTR